MTQEKQKRPGVTIGGPALASGASSGLNTSIYSNVVIQGILGRMAAAQEGRELTSELQRWRELDIRQTYDSTARHPEPSTPSTPGEYYLPYASLSAPSIHKPSGCA